MKCFENIKQLLIWKQEIGPPAVIMLMSAEGETLLLPKYDICVTNETFRHHKTLLFKTSAWKFLIFQEVC